jgi:A/G-specific adenine glycosylase
LRDAAEIAAEILGWYDRNARTMPWRVGPDARADGVRPDAYAVWLSEIMLQQTTVAAVGPYFHEFLRRWPDVRALDRADDDQVMAAWAGLGYYARARNLLKCARAVADELGGEFPDTYAELIKLPGIGPYTAAAIAAIVFERRETVVDGNVERVIARLFGVETPLPEAKPELKGLADRLTPQNRPGDYAQGMMDLGATVCTPRRPSCALCPLTADCAAHAKGIAPELPRRTRKPAKPVRFGVVYIAQRADGAWLLERRPEHGLLGGMSGWPGSDWVEEAIPVSKPPVESDWREVPGEVRHTFTHFHLRLKLLRADVVTRAVPHVGRFVPAAEFDRNDLPTVMRKAFDLAAGAHAFI